LSSPLDNGEIWRLFWPNWENIRFISDESERYDLAISKYRLLPSYAKEVSLPEPIQTSLDIADQAETKKRKDIKYTRYVITDLIIPIVSGIDKDPDAYLENYLQEFNLKLKDFKDIIIPFVKELRRKDYIPNYKEIINWVNWGYKVNEQYTEHRGLCYMAPKMWNMKELLAFLPNMPKIRQKLTDKQKYILDALIKEEKLAKEFLP